ncbi:MAG: hypothetical protein JWQ40_2661 [Segetibacter sp.]|nr:hypothetical protein [Segetibacter sp.]
MPGTKKENNRKCEWQKKYKIQNLQMLISQDFQNVQSAGSQVFTSRNPEIPQSAIPILPPACLPAVCKFLPVPAACRAFHVQLFRLFA